MFFQISPVFHKKTKPVRQDTAEDEESKVELLSLAPFTSNPKIVFNNVVIGTVQTRKLLVKNPTGLDMDLFIKKPIPEEMNLVMSWTEATIKRGSELLLEMVWGPTREESCRHIFSISDGKRVNRDIPITFNSVSPKRVKATGTKNKSKHKPSPVKLSLSRKPISPTKKLRPQKKSPSPKTKSPRKYFSPPRNQHPQHMKYKIHREMEYSLSKEQQAFNYQSNVRGNENNYYFEDRFAFKENKENVSPVQQRFLYNVSGSFTSPSNATFLMGNEKTNERRETYILTPKFEQRDTYTLQTEKRLHVLATNTTFEMQNKFIDATESFFIDSKETSPCFRDSLESSDPKPTWQENNYQNNLTPSLESMLNNRRSVGKLRSNPNFEYQLKVQNLSFSPAITPNSKMSPNNFAPTICSTTSKPNSANNSHEITGMSALNPFAQTNINLNETNETYTKGNTSSETYVKESASFETYVKGNLSGDTYVKDSSIGDFVHLDVSPLSSRTQYRVPSPVFLKPKSFEFSSVLETTRNAYESRLGQNLSAIAEESGVLSDSCLRIGTKRKSASFSSQPIKRERTSIEPKKDWSKCGGAAVRIAKTTSGLNLQQYTFPTYQDKSQVLSSVTETMSKAAIVKNPFLYANIIDPFMTSQIYCNEGWIDQQENNFKKWLNALLTPPDELSTKCVIDVAKVWHECTKKEVNVARTKEIASFQYHTNKKLDYLRKQAQNLFRSKDMSTVLQKACLAVETGKLSIRDDKDLHLNLKLKADITRLILGYNPLWLRIGLETIYNEIIPLKSNSDSHGLANFILERFLKDSHLIKKHKTVYSAKYSSDLKKFVLKKFLILVYFLDQAKNAKLIQHDPCLFCKNAEEKESKLVLIHFARETLSAVGDITKYLKCMGYVVTHVQSYIHEFDYAVNNLGVDLRDGVRLIRVMEIIQMRNDLTARLRVPAISRLQKVHNMQLVFKSLEDNGYQIQYDIIAKDVVDGHKEKTLSFLWQIIYKFEAPLMVKSVTTIQTWFRSLPVRLKRRKLQRIREQRETAAKKIQLWYQRQKKSHIYFALSEFVHNFVAERRRLRATVKLQSYFRMVICRKQFLSRYNTILQLQAYAKGWLIRNNYKQRIDAAILIQKIFRGFLCRTRFLQIKNAVITFQRKYRAIKQMKQVKLAYEGLKRATIITQRRFRAKLEMEICRKEYTTLKNAAIKIQSIYKMRVIRKTFMLRKTATIVIQTRYRAQKKMQVARTGYLSLKKATIFIQRQFRANLKMKKQREAFITLKLATIRIQSFYRMHYSRQQFIRLRYATIVIQVRYKAMVAMRAERKQYLSLKKFVLNVQSRFRANKEMKKTRNSFIQLKKTAVAIQSYYRMYICRKRYLELRKATEVIQQKYRAQKAMQKQKLYFNTLRKSVLTIQMRYRANQLQKNCRIEYLNIRKATITIQTYFKMHITRKRFVELKMATILVQRNYLAQKAMKNQRRHYQKLRNATVILQRRWMARQMCLQEKTRYDSLRRVTIHIQQRFRGNKLMLHVRQKYVEVKTATVKIQTWYKSILTMRTFRHRYIILKKSVVIVEQRYLALKLMRKARLEYEALQKATKAIQQRYRALVQMKNCRQSFLTLKSTTMAMQRRFRANKLMQKHQASYQKLKTTTTFVQNVFRANKMTKLCRNRYILQKNAAITIQRWYRATTKMKKCRIYYNSLKLAVSIIETRYRAKQLMHQEKSSYECLRKAVLTVQIKYKSILEARRVRHRYLELKKASTIIQTRYRAITLAKIQYQRYQRLITMTLFIQRKYRAKKAMQKCQSEFIALRKAATFIQQKYKAQKQMIECRKKYQRLQSACLLVQRKYRAQKLMVLHLHDYCVLKAVVIQLQQRFRANMLAKNVRSQYLHLKGCAIVIQQRYRAEMLMKTQRLQFLQLREASIIVQRRYRANVLMKEKVNEFAALKNAATIIQRRYRAMKAMIIQKLHFEKLKRAAIFVQRRYRAIKIAKYCRSQYLAFRCAATTLQRRFRAKCLMTSCVTTYTRMKWATLVIQRRYRAEKAMKNEMIKYNTLRHATFVIQRRLRATLLSNTQRQWFLRYKLSIRTIQIHYRAYLAMKTQRELYLETRNAVINLQRLTRGYLVRRKYGPLLTPEAVEARRILKIQNAAAVKIQAFWRGYTLRNSKIPVILHIRKIQERRRDEPRPSCLVKTLAQRCEAAMMCMTAENSSLLMVINALEDLDFITRHCRELCIRLSCILPCQLYIIITSAARSLPEMNALNMAALILINFCKFPDTRKNSWDPEYMDGLLNVLLHWCDKEAPVFSTLCTLFWLFGHDEECKKVILGLANIQQRFDKIHCLVHRKQSMVMKSKKLNTNSSFGPVRNVKLPTLTANWGLDYDRPNTFTNAVSALTMLMNILDL